MWNQPRKLSCRFRRIVPVLFLVGVSQFSGCARPPKVTTGTFTTSYTVTIQRGCTQVVVLTSGPAKYALKTFAMDHPMGQRPDTEAVVTTPAGKFVITTVNLRTQGVLINGVLYPDPVPCTGQTITIDRKGKIVTKVVPPPLPVPPAGASS